MATSLFIWEKNKSFILKYPYLSVAGLTKHPQLKILEISKLKILGSDLSFLCIKTMCKEFRDIN